MLKNKIQRVFYTPMLLCIENNILHNKQVLA